MNCLDPDGCGRVSHQPERWWRFTRADRDREIARLSALVFTDREIAVLVGMKPNGVLAARRRLGLPSTVGRKRK